MVTDKTHEHQVSVLVIQLFGFLIVSALVFYLFGYPITFVIVVPMLVFAVRKSTPGVNKVFAWIVFGIALLTTAFCFVAVFTKPEWLWDTIELYDYPVTPIWFERLEFSLSNWLIP